MRSKQSGFTLIETAIAIGLFSILVGIAVGGFAQALKTERQATAFIAVNSNVSELIEQMSREIRTGRNFCNAVTQPTCGNGVDYGNDLTCGVDKIAFQNTAGELTLYAHDGTTINKTVWRIVDGVCTEMGPSALTADSVVVDEASFRITGNLFNDLLQPRITLSFTVRPKDVSLRTLGQTTIQTTVSSRQPDS